MSVDQKSRSLRRKILTLLPRAKIEDLARTDSRMTRPWLASRRHLEDCILENWTDCTDDISFDVKALLRQAGLEI